MYPIIVPIAIPLLVKAIALALSSKGIHLAYKLCHAGKVTPSPIPISTLIKNKAKKPLYAATGVDIVKIDHNTTPQPSTSLPPNLSDRYPPIAIVSM